MLRSQVFKVIVFLSFTVFFIPVSRSEREDLYRIDRGTALFQSFQSKELPPAETGNMKYAGVRSSSYGIIPFPHPGEWVSALSQMTNGFSQARPIAIWNVGVNHRNGCRLEFQQSAGSVQNVYFIDQDRHEKFLSYFDSNGVSVFLQVEPGSADVKQLIKLVLGRYGKHPCVAGFGIDVEWYKHSRTSRHGRPLKYNDVRDWEKQVRSYNKNYRLFVKHYKKDYLGNYRGGVVFVDDSQIFPSLQVQAREFREFADYFYPNTVLFQVGYPADRKWWRHLDDPQRNLASTLAQSTRQDCGVIWVDFTLRDISRMD